MKREKKLQKCETYGNFDGQPSALSGEVRGWCSGFGDRIYMHGWEGCSCEKWRPIT